MSSLPQIHELLRVLQRERMLPERFYNRSRAAALRNLLRSTFLETDQGI
jgi:hypothetical protein